MRKEKARADLKLRLARAAAIAALALCLAAAACNGTRLYAPEGSIQERLHELDYMCRSYLFESGSFTLSEDFADYAPQLARLCLNEARRLGKIIVQPGEEFNERDVEMLETAADALGALALAIEDALEEVNLSDPQSRAKGAITAEYGALNAVVKHIDERHRALSRSDALYR